MTVVAMQIAEKNVHPDKRDCRYSGAWLRGDHCGPEGRLI
jgi:hypothetical protein